MGKTWVFRAGCPLLPLCSPSPSGDLQHPHAACAQAGAQGPAGTAGPDLQLGPHQSPLTRCSSPQDYPGAGVVASALPSPAGMVPRDVRFLPEAEMEAMVWSHLHRLVGGPNNVGAEGVRERDSTHEEKPPASPHLWQSQGSLISTVQVSS